MNAKTEEALSRNKVLQRGLIVIVAVLLIAGSSFAETQKESLMAKFLKRFNPAAQNMEPVKKEEDRPATAAEDVTPDEPLEAAAVSDGEAAEENAPVPQKKEELDFGRLSNKELAKMVAEKLNYHRDALNIIPQLKAVTGEDGTSSYVYVSEGGITRKLEELDRGTLINLYKKVTAEINRINTERLLKQLEDINRINRGAYKPPAAPAEIYTPPSVPQLPKVYTPPKLPQVPKVYTPPKLPDIPKTPKVYTPPKIPQENRRY